MGSAQSAPVMLTAYAVVVAIITAELCNVKFPSDHNGAVLLTSLHSTCSYRTVSSRSETRKSQTVWPR
jgi:hypothetical protein